MIESALYINWPEEWIQDRLERARGLDLVFEASSPLARSVRRGVATIGAIAADRMIQILHNYWNEK